MSCAPCCALQERKERTDCTFALCRMHASDSASMVVRDGGWELRASTEPSTSSISISVSSWLHSRA